MIGTANPVLAMLGQISAIILCLFVFIFVILAVAFNLAMAFGLGWLREKTELIKLLRPHIESVNKTTEAAKNESAPTENEQPVVRAVVSVPGRVQAVDTKVDQTTEPIVKAAIEFRARTVQVQTIAKAFFVPGAGKQKSVASGEKNAGNAGYRALLEKSAAEVSEQAPTKDGQPQAARSVTAGQLNHVPTR